MRVLDLEDIGPHYAETLRRWLHAFDERIGEIRALGFDERFERMWRYYLTYCEGAFRARHCSDVQVLLGKPRAKPVSGLAPFERG
jgi:cyclopropane-fatty-acyl-phospholipid synthase